jgi:hypothetical protein
VCMRSMAGNSRAMVAVAMWKEDGVIHHNWGSVITHTHLRIIISVSGHNHTHCAVYWEQPGLKMWTEFTLTFHMTKGNLFLCSLSKTMCLYW